MRVLFNPDRTCPSCRVHRDAPVTEAHQAEILKEREQQELRGAPGSRPAASGGDTFLVGALVGGVFGLLGLGFILLTGGPEARRGAITLYVVRLAGGALYGLYWLARG